MSSSDATAAHVSVLGLDPLQPFSEADVKRAYRSLALKLHPDKNRNDAKAEVKFHALQTAYELLLDPRVRADHESRLRARAEQRERYEAQGREMAMARDDLERREREAAEDRESYPKKIRMLNRRRIDDLQLKLDLQREAALEQRNKVYVKAAERAAAVASSSNNTLQSVIDMVWPELEAAAREQETKRMIVS
jgi:curved DNA-binding protein CbpA